MIYEAKYDKLVISISLFVIILCLSITIIVSYAAIKEGDEWISFIVILINFFILVVPYIFSPRGYENSIEGIIVRRIAKDVVIPYEKIKNAYISNFSLKGVRLWASGGLYGYFGLFYVSGLGKVKAYLTRRKNIIVIKADEKYAISPENPEQFLMELKTIVSIK